MHLLALETATSVCSVALSVDGRTTVELTLNRPRAHSENLVSMIDDALRYGNIVPADVDAVAVSAGPGSFTGLRIGVSTAKGFATAVDADLVAVPSLEALASGVTCAGPGDVIGAAFDARRDEAYVAIFRLDEDRIPRPLKETAALKSGDLPEWIGAVPDRLWLVGSGWPKMMGALNAAAVPYRHLPDVHSAAGLVAIRGLERLHSGETEDLVSFEPYYLKEFVTTTPSGTPFEKLSF